MRIVLPLICVAGLLVPGGPGSAGDARVGTVSDLQGSAWYRPVARERWTPLGVREALMPGDQVRTSPRGANAVEILLNKGGGVVVGPGTMVDFAGGGVRLYRGELEIRPGKGGSVPATGPGGFQKDCSARTLLRAGRQSTEELGQDPRWLTGYRASTTDEWMGSLVAKIDGRDVPLSVGYHKVTVDIRDQISRTTVEQSFVNSTVQRLEGVFYFPLPPDASISGFGMWIGDELVEADIVEKQRARAIYEDILRRKKDPGLLEWSGGNLFKARVFPIEAHSEKRIRLRYTQVLPLRGGQLRYRYALRSELLRSRPLRELKLRVLVSLEMPLKKVHSPTHEVRVRQREGAAVVEFDAEEFRPQHDFELVIEVERGKPLTLIPHRRGDDGYFMMLLTPPDPASGGLERELLADGKPLEVVLLADTSGSMDGDARAAQSDFVQGLLSLLGPRDRFRLLTCDIRVRQLDESAIPVTPDSIAGALRFLEERVSLGWTDLEGAFETAMRVASPGSVIVYIGDGIGTTGDADPVALAGRLQRLAPDKQLTCHAVSASSTFEAAVLQAIARRGGGSVRELGNDPSRAAYELLAEAAEPAVKDLRVRFEGIRTARVYPERLPNLPAGTQQVILGRYLPSGSGARGKVIVTGTRSGKPVRYVAELELPDQDAGNSFLPRLWARHHIQALLREGRSAAIKSDIVALSEEYGIMTPYTSFLVLENDEDRVRYGVRRRVRMRDGERYFAEGRDEASTEILRQQMQVARSWRLRLRARMLREIGRLGKDLHGWKIAWGQRRRIASLRGSVAGYRIGKSGAPAAPAPEASRSPRAGEAEDRSAADRSDEEELADLGEPDVRYLELEGLAAPELSAEEAPASPRPSAPAKRRRSKDAKLARPDQDSFGAGNRSGSLRTGRPRPQPLSFASLHFPALPAAPPSKDGARPDWPAEILDLLHELDRRPAITSLPGGLLVRQRSETVHPLPKHVLGQGELLALISRDSWFVRRRHDHGQSLENWLRGDERGVVAAAFRLGRRRGASPSDRLSFGLGFPDHASNDLLATYRDWSASIKSRSEETVVVRLEAPRPRNAAIELEVDLTRKLVLSSQSYAGAKCWQTVKLSAFENTGGLWWATRAEVLDADNRQTKRYERSIASIDRQQFDREMRNRLGGYGDVMFLDGAEPPLAAARQAVHERQADLADHLRIVLHYASTGQWEELWKAWQGAAALARQKPAMPWIRATLLASSRRGEELKERLTTLVGRVMKRRAPADVFLAEQLLNLASSHLEANEALVLAERLREVFYRDRPEKKRSQKRWLTRLVALLEGTGQQPRAMELRRNLLRDYPNDPDVYAGLIQALEAIGKVDEAIALARTTLRDRKRWQASEAAQFYDLCINALWKRRKLTELGEVAETWIAELPEQQHPYLVYLSVLLFMNSADAVDTWIAKRFAEEPDKSDRARTARLGATIRFCLGQGWNFRSHRIDDKQLGPLADLAYRLAESGLMDLAANILGNYQFSRSDACQELLARLSTDLSRPDTLRQMSNRQLGYYLSWIDWTKGKVDARLWSVVTGQVLARWESAKTVHDRRTLARHVLTLMDAHGRAEDALAFVRHRLATESDELRPEIARELLERLAGQSWSEGIEAELLALVPSLEPETATDSVRRRIAAGAIRYIAETLYAMRRIHLLGPAKVYEKLPRNELRLAKRKARLRARQALARQFQEASEGADELSRPWFEIESLCFAVQSGAQAKEIEGRARELLAGISAESPLLRILRERASLVLSHASSRRAAPEGLIDRTLALYRKMLEEHPERLDWRYQIFRLQLALDRTEDLERELRGWIVPARAENTWRIALGYILAENGRLEEAIKIFELVAANDELGPGDWEALANWYLATNDDARRNDALLRRYASMSEWQLARLLRQKGSELARRGDGVPSELDPDNLRALRALLAKARQPERHLGLVGDLYKKVKDFRLLESLADGMLGHSARQVYPYLLHSRQVIRLIHEEATSDELVARIRALARKAGPGLDRRALLMLGSLVDRRASEVGNQPGPHMRRALAAMTAAFQGVWLTGERRLMAGFLAALGKQGGDGFAAEQERQLRELCRLETERSFDRLAIAGDLQRSIWAHGRHAAAIDGLEAAIAEYREAMGSKIANETNGVIETLIGWLEERRQFTRAESWLSAELRRTELGSQNDWLTQRLYSVYVKCLELGGTVSLGRGKSLYQRARTLIGDALFGRGPDQVRQTLEKFLALHVAAKRNAGIHGAPEELERFAGGKLRELLGIVPNQSQQLVQSVATTLHQLLGTKAALRLLIERIETEPRWLARAGRGGWQRFVHLLAKWRGQTPDLGGLEPRLLAIVLGELERDLTTLRSVNRTMYQINYSRFWSEKRSDFARTAMKVVELHPGSSARQLYAARYLWHGLALRKPAIQVLAGAEERRILDAAGSYTLVTWLHEEKRFAESLPVLERLLEAHPDRIDYRLSRVRALHGVSRDHAALALLKDSAVDLHKRKLWNEASILKLAELSLACGFHVESVGYFEELIPLHQRTHARRGVGNGILSHYLSQLARAYGKLGNADKAVETASAAVVAWDPPNRRNALGSLKKVVSEIGDLDAYVERWSKKVLSTGMDAPVVRKVLGEVYLDRRDYPKAIAQLDLARSLAPDDAEVYRSLIRALEGMGDEQAACRCLLDSIRVSPLDMDLYESLARRYESQGDSDAAERAWTSLVEIMPGEAEGHRRLARHRETQKRYAEASVQWRQVVRVRSLEPDGWLALARVQVRSGRRDAAKETLQHVLESKWEDRFGDVHAQARRLLAQLAGGPPR